MFREELSRSGRVMVRSLKILLFSKSRKRKMKEENVKEARTEKIEIVRMQERKTGKFCF